jgi:hypothetical protein
MRFGKSAKRIKNKAHINKEQSPAELKMLLQEMKRCVPVCGWCAWVCGCLKMLLREMKRCVDGPGAGPVRACSVGRWACHVILR